MVKKSKLISVALLIIFIQQIQLLSTFECGTRKTKINHAIVRGQAASSGHWPWHVAIYRQEKSSSSYICGGTLISEIFVLTADHCVQGENGYVVSSRRIFVRLGLYNLRHLNRATFQQHDVYAIHRIGTAKNLKNDIAIIELRTEADFTEHVQPACLNQEENLVKQYGTVVGWGLTETGELSSILRSQQMPVVSTMECLENNDGIFRTILDRSIFCAGFDNGTTVCNGDSGGGLHFVRNGVWHIGGIVSFTAPRDNSNHCHLNSYAGFTNVYHFLPWIRNITQLRYLHKKSDIGTPCSDSDHSGNKQYIVHNNQKATFLEAWRLCHLYGTRMATVMSETESLLLEQTIAKSGNTKGPWFIGGTDLGSEGNFIWISTNKPLNGYQNYAPGQPDDDHNEHCLEVGRYEGVTWNDIQCDWKQHFICEFLSY